MISRTVLALTLPATAAVALGFPGGEIGRSEPVQAVTVGPGHAAIDASVIRAHTATWRLVQAASGRTLGRFVRTTELVHHTEEEPAILARWHFTTPDRSALDIQYLDRETLMPVARYLTAPTGMWVHYQSAKRLVATFTRRAGGEPVAVDIANPSPAFNNAMLDFVLAALPLDDGYAASWPSLSTSGSIRDAFVTVNAAVDGRDEMTLPDGGTVRAWRVRVTLSRGNAQRVWIGDEPPYLIRREALNPQGDVTVRWELVNVARTP